MDMHAYLGVRAVVGNEGGLELHLSNELLVLHRVREDIIIG